jgi:hypothetical protein
MASAGMITVTNSFDVKTPEAMTAISTNLLTVPPTLDGVISGVREATARVDDHEARARGAAVEWSRGWDEALNPKLMHGVLELLAAC